MAHRKIISDPSKNRETWQPKKRIVRDQSISSTIVVATSTLTAIASMFGWNRMPAAAEWLVTMGAHGYTLLLLGALGTLSMLPDLRPRNLARSMSWSRVAFATMRGFAIGTILTIVLPDRGDLWNRSHEIAFVLVIVMAIGLFRPWDIAAVPLRIVLGWMIRQPRLPLSRRLVRHIADYQMKALYEFESTPAAGLSIAQRIRRVRIGTAPPQWFLLALEQRLARLADLLASSQETDERRRREFEEMAHLELQIACFLPKNDLDRILPACKDRVAECLTLTLRSWSLDDDDAVTNRMNPLIEALWRLGDRSSSANCKGLRMIKAARQTRGAQPQNAIVQLAFESKLERLSSEDLSFAIIALAYLSLRMNEERLFGWSEGLARRLEALAGTVLRFDGPDHDLILATKTLALASQIPLERIESESSEDPDLARILAEAQACIGQVGGRTLARSIPGTPTPHARHRMRKIAVPIQTHAFRYLRHERNGLHGMLPAGLWVQGLVLSLVFVVIGAICNIDEHTRFASSVVQITDPFRSGSTRPGQMRVSSTAIDARSADVVLGTPDGAYIFEADAFRHSTEAVGPGGPSGSIQALAPIKDGGILARVGKSGAGIDLRSPDGDWKALIKIPPSSLGSRDILDVLRESTTTLLILTPEDILRYHEPDRALETVPVNPPLSDDCIDWAMAGGEILILRDSGLVRLTSNGSGFDAHLVSMPTTLGKPAELHSTEVSFLVRTSKDALISLVSDDQWRVIAGGRQFEDSSATIGAVVANPGSDSVLLTITDNDRHGIRVRPAGTRYWREGYLPEGVTHGEILPLLDPAGQRSLLVDDAGGLWLASKSASDSLALEISRLAPKAIVESMSTIPAGFTLVLRTPVGIELRTGNWGTLSDLGARILTVRPIEIRGGLVAAIPDPATPARMLIVDREGGVIEYDRERRSMIGDRLQLLLPNGEPCRQPQSATLSGTELIVISEEGEVCSYSDPSMIEPGQPAGVLRSRATILPRFAARPDVAIESLRDTRLGFELIDSLGEAWEYDLTLGWRCTSNNISSSIDPASLQRLQDGTMIGLSGQGDVVWRGEVVWQESEVQLDEVMPCTNGIAGIDIDGRTVVIRTIRNGRPSADVVFEPQDFARLEFPLHDAVTVGKNGDLWIAHQGGLSVYHPGNGGSWSRCAVGDESFVRVEAGGDYIFAESNGGDLWGVAPQTERGVLLVPECESWTPCGEGRILALRADHRLQILDGLRAKTIIRSDSGLGSTDPVSATCSAEAAWILESERLYKVTGDGEVEVIPLPGNSARAVASNSETIHILIDSEVRAYSPAKKKWLPSVIDDIDQIVELPGLVAAIGNDRRLILVDNDNLAIDVLPGAVASRAHSLADSGWMLEDDRGIWMNSRDGLLRWLPMGGGGFLPANPQGATIQKAGDRAFYLRSDKVLELSDTAVGPHSSLIADRRADQVLEFADTLALVMDNALSRTTDVQGQTIRFCFGKPSDDSKRIADLVQGPPGEAILLSDQGRLIRYDAKTRRFMRESDSGIKSPFARLHPLNRSTWLVSDDEAGTLEILRTNAGLAPSQLNDVRSWGILDSQVIAITGSGSLRRGDPTGWKTVRSAPSRQTETVISSYAPLGLQSMIVLSRQGEILLRSSDQPGVTPVTEADDDFQSIRTLSDGRVISQRRAPKGQASEILVIDEQRDIRRPGSFMLVEGPVDPQLLDPNQRVLSSVNGAALWNLEDARLDLQEIELLKDANDGKRAFVLDSEGALGEITLDRIGSRVLSMFDPEKVESLALSLVGEPVVITKDSIDRVNKPRLLLAQNTTAVPLDRGVAWLDDLRRLRVDELSFDHLIPSAEDMNDRIDINLDIAQRFTAGDTEIVGDGKRHWRFRPASRSLEEIRLVPKNGMTLYAADTSSRILLNDASGTFHFLGEGRDAEMDPPPGIGGEVVPFQRWITSIDKNIFYALDLDQPVPDWIAIPLDPTLPPNIIAAFPLRKSNTCLGVGSGGSVWQRTGFRTWKQIADEGTLPDLTDAGLELREPGGPADLEFVISSRVDGEIRSAWIFSNDQLIARMRQEEALVIAPVGQPPQEIESERLGRVAENTQGTRPEGIDPKLWDLLRRSLDGLAFRVPIAPAAISASGLVESMDQLDSSLTNERLDTWVSDLSITGAATDLVPILQFSGDTGWSAEALRSAAVPVVGPWVNLGSDASPVFVRRTDGLLGTRAPRVIQQASGNKLQVTRFDGSKTEVTLPLQRNRSDSRRFRFANNKTVDYFDGNAWKPFRRADYPFSILDTPAKKTGSLAHLEEAGTWVIDANDDLWFQKSGTSNRKSIVLPEGAKAIALVWRSAGQGARVLTVKTDTGIFQVDQERVGDRFIEVAKPEEAPVIRAGLEWRDGFSTPFFDGNPVWLRGLAFDHEIPTGIAVDAGSLRADLQINGSPRQRRLDPRTGELTGRLLEPKKTAPRQPQVIRTPAGRLDLDRRTGKVTLRTPSLVGDEVLESEWSPSNGAFEVDRVHRLLPVRDGWIQLTPKGLVLGVTSTFSESTILSRTDAPKAVDLRASINQGVYVKREDGSVLKIDSIAASPRVVPLNQTAFSEDAMHNQVPARRIADRAFAKFHGQQMPIPSPLYWDAGQGAFSFELVNRELVESMATTSQGQEIRASTMSGPLWLDHQGQMRLQDSNIKPMTVTAVASTAADTIQLRRSKFSQGQARPSLSFSLAGEPEGRLEVPWKLEDGLLPHRTFTAVAPLGPNAAGGFSRLGVHRFSEDRFTPPALLFDDLRRKPTIYLSDGLNACQARFEDDRDSIELTEAGVIRRLPDNSPPNSASCIDVVPGHPRTRIRRNITEGRRSFEIFIKDGLAREQLQLTKAGFLLDQTRASVFDADGRLVISGDGEKLLRIENRSSCLDASIINQNLAGMNLELGFADPTLEAAFLTDADQNSLRVFKDETIPFPAGVDAAAHLQRLQPLNGGGTPKPKQFFVGDETSPQKRRIFEWHRGNGKPIRDLVERNGVFDHDRITSVARLGSNRTDHTDLIAKGADSLSWRDGETGSLVDVVCIRPGLDGTPLVSTESGDWNVRSEGRWHLLLLDDETSSIRIKAAGDRSLRLGFDTPDWIWQWADKPEVMDRTSGRIWSPTKTSWLHGDEIRAFIGEGPDRLYTTNAGARVSSQEPNDTQTGALTGPNPKSVRTNLGTMFISEDETSLVSFSEGMIKVHPRKDAELEASGDQLRISISEYSMPSFVWHPPSNNPTDSAINLPFPFTSLEGDHVLACGTIADLFIALTPLGFFDTQNPIAPANGPPLGRDGRKVVSPGLAWLESESGPPVKVVLSDGRGGYRIEENDDSTRYELDDNFTSSDSVVALLDDPRWALVRRFEAGTWTKKFLDQDRGLEMNAELGIRTGQLRFDQVRGLGIDEDGPWLWTEMAEERFDASGRLMPVRLHDPGALAPNADPSAAIYSRQIAETAGTRIRLPEFDLVVGSLTLDLIDGTPVVTKPDGARIFRLPFGVLIVDANGTLQWIRNQKKWFQQSRSDRRAFESSQ